MIVYLAAAIITIVIVFHILLSLPSDRRDGGGPISIEPRMHEIWLENDLSGRSLRRQRRRRRRRHCPLFLSPSLILPSVDAVDAAHPTEQIRRLFLLPIPKGIP